jgi:hypothetical protein
MSGLRGGTAWGHTPTMSLKSAAFLALAGMILLSVLVLADFVRDAAAALNGLIPAARVLTSLIYLLASLGLTVFFYVFYKRQS